MGCSASKSVYSINSSCRPQSFVTETTGLSEESNSLFLPSRAEELIENKEQQPVVNKESSSTSQGEAWKCADVISYEEASKLSPKSPEEMWAIVKGTSDKDSIHLEPTKNRKGWRTIRIFVSSTFKDFHQEREVLVKELSQELLCPVQPTLLPALLQPSLGVPKDAATEETIKICLGELDRCYEDNVAPFFLNLAGQTCILGQTNLYFGVALPMPHWEQDGLASRSLFLPYNTRWNKGDEINDRNEITAPPVETLEPISYAGDDSAIFDWAASNFQQL
eukprot:gene17019-18733_t